MRGGYGGRGGHSTVTYVIPSGSMVKKGDVLVRLDTKVIEETISLGKTDTNIAKAQLARTKADLSKAEFAEEAYLNGDYRTQQKALQNRREIALRNLRVAESFLSNARGMFEKGYVSELELEANQYTVDQAQLDLEVR